MAKQTGANNLKGYISSSYRTDKTVNEIISAINNNKQVIFIFNDLENSEYYVYSATGYYNRFTSGEQEYTLFTHGGNFSAHSLNDYFIQNGFS